jgi:REP element-mobilizing transposase RayT
MAKRLNRQGRQGVLHYVTINIRDRRKAFLSAVNARAACLTLRQQCNEHPAKLIVYVVMPEHLHFITNPQYGDINRLLSQLKPAIIGRIADLATKENNSRVLSWLYDTNLQRNRLWQDSKHNLHLYTERLIWQKINYIHTNPIARQLVNTAAEYPFSSFRAMYEVDDEIIIPIDRDFWWYELVSVDDE